jgi:hypothetical protein
MRNHRCCAGALEFFTCMVEFMLCHLYSQVKNLWQDQQVALLRIQRAHNSRLGSSKNSQIHIKNSS